MSNNGTFAANEQNLNARYLAAGNQIFNVYTEDSEGNDTAGSARCPECGREPQDININTSQVICSNCEYVYYIWQPNRKVSSYRTLSPRESVPYRRLIFHIEAFIELELYEDADNLFDEAITLSSEESAGWELKAFCYFLKNSKNSIIRDRGKLLTKYFSIARRADDRSETYNAVAGRVAYHLSSSVKHRIRQLEDENELMFSRYKFSELIQTWQSCFLIFPDTSFLKQIIVKISADGKLIIENSDGKWINVYQDFNAVEIRRKIIRNIRKIEHRYQPPILSREPSSIIALPTNSQLNNSNSTSDQKYDSSWFDDNSDWVLPVGSIIILLLIAFIALVGFSN
jgi:hypothetical protein